MKVIVSILLYNSALDILSKNLAMFSKQDFLDDPENSIEIIICDNNRGSQIEAVKALSHQLNIKNIHFINSENIGFGSGHNKVFAFAKSNFQFNYFLIANPDGVPHSRMISYLVHFAKKNNNKGIFEALQFPVEHPKIYHQKTNETAWCSGCCCMFPTKVFEDLKGFDERFFMYVEDVDISWRARAVGYHCYIVDEALFSNSIDNKNRDLSKQNILMYKSAYKLAIKYHNQIFANKMLSKLENLISCDEINLLEVEAQKMQIANYAQYKKIIHFDKKFKFSEARW